MAFQVNGQFVLPHEAASLQEGDTYKLNPVTDLEDANPSPQGLLLEVVEVRDRDYLCRIVELL